jgi:hypothetical protein
MSQNLTKDEIRDIMGREPLDPSIKSQAQIISDNINTLSPLVANKVLESMTPDEIRSLAGLTVTNSVGDGSMPAPTAPTAAVNSNLASMTGRQFQQLERIKRKFEAGKLTREQAAMMLKNSFGLTDEDVSVFLDANSSDEQFASQDEIDFALINEFSQCGEDKDLFEIISSKPAREEEYFAEVKELSQLEANILNLIKKDPKATSDVMAGILKQDAKTIEAALKILKKAGKINESIIKIGEDKAIERTVTDVKVDAPKATTTSIFIRYSYDGPQDEKNRDFCAQLLKLNRLYSRSDIERMSERLGYSVWDRRGGWFTQPDGEARPYCRHQWNALRVVKKK